MTLSISFYDGVKYHGPDFNQRDKDFYGNGVLYPATSQFPLTYNSNMTVTVGAGIAWVDGYRIANDSNGVVLTVPAADATNPRIDIVQIGHDDINSTYSLVVKKGVAQASPVEPGADTNYIKLYAISVSANATSITSANVTDRRAVLSLNVDGSQINQGGAVPNTDPAYLAVKNSTYVAAGTGITTTAGTDSQTVALAPATASTIGGMKPGANVTLHPDGTIDVPAPYTLPADVAKTDVSQTWTQPQTFEDNVTIFNGAGSNGVAGTAPFLFMQNYSTQTGGQATFLSNWAGNNGWGFGGVDAQNVQIGVANKTTGAWVTGQSFTFNVAGGLTASGLTTLSGGATVPSGQTLTINGPIAGSTVGGASGLATLDPTGNVPKAQLGNVPPSNLLTMPNAWIG